MPVIYPPQPTLPPEGLFSDAEFSFIDESPRGFFPENQDSNWGYRRKIFTDEIHELFEQLEIIYSEIFPSTSQTYLDEWERMVGLPRNPTGKTLGQRRTMVMNRLRGGPFTRRQRREIVESYITATFGEPILLLPPGHELVVAGSPLYNEVGDVTLLYMIVETVPSFQYEVRIKAGMALDQVALERDLRHFTPAGIFIIFNYNWEGFFPVQTGVGVDLISSRKIVSDDVGAGTDGIWKGGADTGSSADIAGISLVSEQTGTGVDASTPLVSSITGDEFMQGDDEAGLKRPDTDVGTGEDEGFKSP